MGLIEILFVICWVFSLLLFFLSGVMFQSMNAQKAKLALFNDCKAFVYDIFEKVNNDDEKID